MIEKLVLVGTRFIASREALTAPQAKDRIVAASGDATLRTTVFEVVRGYDGGWAGVTHGRERELLASREAEEARYWKAVDLSDSVLPAAEIVRRILH